jgi:hypothetical protein
MRTTSLHERVHGLQAKNKQRLLQHWALFWLCAPVGRHMRTAMSSGTDRSLTLLVPPSSSPAL